MESVEGEALLNGQAEIWKHMFAFIDSMALKCAIELRIPDIIHSHGGPITLSQIASCIDSPSSPEISYLERIMRVLGRKNIFTAHHPSDSGEPLYGLTHSSRWLVTGTNSNQLGSVFLVENHPYLVNSWHFLSQSVKEGGIAMEKAYGGVYIDLASKDQQFNNIFNEGMACNSKFLTKEILAGYKHGFDSLKSLVDVAGGIGGLISEIVKSYSHIKGINFDLPHVITTAPVYDGVTHVSGDMFHTIPNADALLFKWVLHNWSDEACVKILKNCRKAIPAKAGKVIIIDVVLQPDGKCLFDDARYAFDLVMMVNTRGGKERTEPEWKKLFAEGGFPRYKIIKIPALQSIIEAYPE